jgi:TPP-dependent indolepyruvate ferredoxin oxidoreductase alpha subunit
MTLLERLKNSVAFMEKEKEDMDEVSWQYQDGIILSGNEAKYIIEKLEELEKQKASQEEM